MPGVKQRVVVVGASPKPDRYSNRAMVMLRDHGHEVVPVHPTAESIHGIRPVKRLADVAPPVDTVTLYVSEAISNALQPDLLALHPGRVIFNPGAENAPLRRGLESHGIRTLEACTLVLLRTGQFA